MDAYINDIEKTPASLVGKVLDAYASSFAAARADNNRILLENKVVMIRNLGLAVMPIRKKSRFVMMVDLSVSKSSKKWPTVTDATAHRCNSGCSNIYERNIVVY